MRALTLLGVMLLAAACHPAGDVSGLYSDAFVRPAGATGGSFIPCDQPKSVWVVSDSSLAAAYRRAAGHPYEAMFVRLRGLKGIAGSVYGGPHTLDVHRVLEIRARRAGDCPAVPDSVLRVLGSAVTSRDMTAGR
jgi:hypothetical protein